MTPIVKWLHTLCRWGPSTRKLSSDPLPLHALCTGAALAIGRARKQPDIAGAPCQLMARMVWAGLGLCARSDRPSTNQIQLSH